MQEFNTMEELLHKAVLIEQQNKRKSYTRNQNGSSSKPAQNKEEKDFNKPIEEVKTSVNGRDDKRKAPATRSRDVKCFKCHGIGHYANECSNKKLVILLEDGEYESEELQLLIDTDEETMDYPVKGELLVTRRILSVKQKKEEKNQREKLFHTRCQTQDKVCSLIIDGGSCTNMASSSLVEGPETS